MAIFWNLLEAMMWSSAIVGAYVHKDGINNVLLEKSTFYLRNLILNMMNEYGSLREIWYFFDLSNNNIKNDFVIIN